MSQIGKLGMVQVDKVSQSQPGNQVRQQMECVVRELQKYLCQLLQQIEDRKEFSVEDWTKDDGEGNKGYGRTCTLEDGGKIERSGVCVSTMTGILPPAAVLNMKSRGHSQISDDDTRFFVTGVSVIIHPQNPHVCTMHFNFRYFEVMGKEGDWLWWFGGGSDLTPYYVQETDFADFHGALKRACDELDPVLYPLFKHQCDNYFYHEARAEHRGIGGIFYDDLNEYSPSDLVAFSLRCGRATIDSYVGQMRDRWNTPFSEDEREWQLLRRGRYVEFNLLYDRGTKFGIIASKTRIETILLSLPRVVRWEYKHKPKDGSPEALMLHVLQFPRDWI